MHQRGDAVSSLVYEANARARDPVYGCVGAISCLQSQVSQLQMQLAVAQAEILCIQMQQQQQDNQDQAAAAAAALAIANNPFEADDDKSSSFFNLPQLLGFTSSNTNVIYDSFKKESLYEYGHHDMVS